MANPSVPFTRRKSDPSLADVLDTWKKDVMLSMNCHAIATVQEFNSSNQTITATVNYKKTQFRKKQGSDSYEPVLIDYPILLDVPVVCLGGGPGKLTFPISSGDQCIILFNDRAIDNWFQSGQVGALSSSRLHSISDGIAIVGLHSMQNSISGYDMARAVLSYSGTKVAVGEGKVLIENEITTLMTLLSALITAIKALVMSDGSTVSAPSQAALDAVKLQMEGLLE